MRDKTNTIIMAVAQTDSKATLLVPALSMSRIMKALMMRITQQK